MFAAPAHHHAAPVASADSDRPLLHGRKNDYAFSSIKQVFGDVVRNIENFLEHRAGVLHAINFSAVVRGDSQGKVEKSHEQCNQLFHLFSSDVWMTTFYSLLGFVLVADFKDSWNARTRALFADVTVRVLLL